MDNSGQGQVSIGSSTHQFTVRIRDHLYAMGAGAIGVARFRWQLS